MKGNPTPVPAGRHETPSAGINWKLFLLVAGIIGIAFFAGMMMQGDGDSISSTVDADSPNIDIGPDSLPVVVETETKTTGKTSVPVKHLTDEEVGRITEFKDMKRNVLNLYEFRDDSGPNYRVPVGAIILDKNRLSGLEFDFEGTHFSNFNTEFGEHQVTVTADLKESEHRGAVLMWQFELMNSNERVGSGAIYNERNKHNIDVRFIRDEWEKGEFIYIGLRRLNQ